MRKQKTRNCEIQIQLTSSTRPGPIFPFLSYGSFFEKSARRHIHGITGHLAGAFLALFFLLVLDCGKFLSKINSGCMYDGWDIFWSREREREREGNGNGGIICLNECSRGCFHQDS